MDRFPTAIVGRGRRTAPAPPWAARSVMTAQYAPASGMSGRRATRATGEPPHSQRTSPAAFTNPQSRVPRPCRRSRLSAPPPPPSPPRTPQAHETRGGEAAAARRVEEESPALVPPMIQEREDATVPQDVDHRPPAGACRDHMLPPLHAEAPCRREQAHEPGHERRHQRPGPAELHPARSRATAATRPA